MLTEKLNAELRPWADYAGAVSWECLLVGNGASRAVWDRFSYPSLYDVALDVELADHLSEADVDLFARLENTKNFEAVLASLLSCRIVSGALDLRPIERILERYVSIQAALVAAVHRVHVPWSTVPSTSLMAIRSALLEHKFVFSTNYDLLIYWAMMVERPQDFRDYFWGVNFDAANAEIWGKATRVLYLHGALHLYRDSSGRTFKERADGYANLLDQFGERPDAVPLCITEGTAAQKVSAISRSDYLTFAYQKFGQESGPLVILGQALGTSDQHLVDAIARHRNRTLAIGIYPIDDEHTVKDKAHFIGAFPRADILFFDSRTHPLGDPALRI